MAPGWGKAAQQLGDTEDEIWTLASIWAYSTVPCCSLNVCENCAL